MSGRGTGVLGPKWWAAPTGRNGWAERTFVCGPPVFGGGDAAGQRRRPVPLQTSPHPSFSGNKANNVLYLVCSHFIFVRLFSSFLCFNSSRAGDLHHATIVRGGGGCRRSGSLVPRHPGSKRTGKRGCVYAMAQNTDTRLQRDNEN